jgi:hypothetical protein
MTVGSTPIEPISINPGPPASVRLGAPDKSPVKREQHRLETGVPDATDGKMAHRLDGRRGPHHRRRCGRQFSRPRQESNPPAGVGGHPRTGKPTARVGAYSATRLVLPTRRNDLDRVIAPVASYDPGLLRTRVPNTLGSLAVQPHILPRNGTCSRVVERSRSRASRRPKEPKKAFLRAVRQNGSRAQNRATHS